MRIYIARHGQTQWNVEHRTQGRTDIPLNETGRAQAQALAEQLRGIPFCAVYASPLSRARDTALPTAQAAGAPLVCDARLIEREFGAWEGKRFSLLREEYPEIWQQWMQNPYAAQPPGAEPMPAVRARCAQFLAALEQRHGPQEDVLAVCHSIPARMLIALIIGLAPERLHEIPLENASYSAFCVEDGRGALLAHSGGAHLEGVLCG